MAIPTIERKLIAALICTATLPLAIAFLITRPIDSHWLLLAIAPTAALAFVGGRLVADVYRDVTRRPADEQRLQSTKRVLESLLDNIPTMIFAKDANDLRFTHLNRAGEELLGYRRDELYGQTDYAFFPPEQADFFMHKDREVLAQGNVVDIAEETISTRQGPRILHTRKVPVLDDVGRPLHLLGISMDITRQKEHEHRILALVDELQHHATLLESSNRELESFCYSVSHDLRTPLRAINGFTQILSEHLARGESAEAQRYCRRICQASERMAQLIDDLLEFSRLGRQLISATNLDMDRMVSRVLDEIAPAGVAGDAQFEVHTLLPAHGDRDMVQRVWQNLIDNALKYSSDSPRAVITINSTPRGNHVVYQIKDNGVGFDMRYSEKIFGVFERLHGADEFPGTGVGLAIVRRILSRNGGEIWAESVPGCGATFYFSLPRAASDQDGAVRIEAERAASNPQ